MSLSGAVLPGWSGHTYCTAAFREIAALIAIQIVCWTLIPLYISHSMPLDVVSDMLPWGHEWQLGYYKHPPLPAWLAEFAFERFSDVGVYLLSQVAIGLTYLFVYLLGAEMMPRRMAAAGTILLVGVFYFSIPTPEFNNNVAQMPTWAAAAFFFYRGLHSREWKNWIWLGFAAGFGLLAKYSTAMLLLVMVFYTIVHPNYRRVWLDLRPYLAIVVALLIFLPHLLWLTHNHFETLAYADTRAGRLSGVFARVAAPAKFMASQVADQLPAIFILVLAGLATRNFGRGLTPAQHSDFLFLLAVGLGPSLITFLLSPATGLGLRDMWGAPMWNVSGLTLVMGAASSWRRVSFPRLYAGAAVVFGLSLLGYVAAMKVVPTIKGAPSRLDWPDRAMAQRLSEEFQRAIGKPLRIVGGDDWLAGLVAMRSDQRPSVISGGDFRTAPWITPARLQQEGALIIWPHGSRRRPPAMLSRFRGFRSMGTMVFRWPGALEAPPLSVDWGIIFPSNAPKISRSLIGARR